MLLQRLGNDPLQLTIGRAELVGSPFFNRCQRVRIDAQDEVLGFVFFLSHNNERPTLTLPEGREPKHSESASPPSQGE